MPVTKRSILITGCSQGGAGNALALEFASQGLRVFATARSLNSMSNLPDKGIEILALDVSVPSSIAALKAEIMERTGGRLDILYNNAGTMYEAPAIEADATVIREMFDANVFGLFNVITAFTPLLIAATASKGPQPTIANVGSIVSHIPYPFAAAYNASKAAVNAYTNTLRLELSPWGIRVVTIHMGQVATNLQSAGKINFGGESLYVELEGKVKARAEEGAVAKEEFARQVAKGVLGGKNEDIWKGTNAFVVWAMSGLGVRAVMEWILKGPVGLADQGLVRGVYEKGLRSVSKE
ncbi:hypothetical protein BJX70DRAFT_388832 [Aspergillus crustosus]